MKKQKDNSNDHSHMNTKTTTTTSALTEKEFFWLKKHLGVKPTNQTVTLERGTASVV